MDIITDVFYTIFGIKSVINFIGDVAELITDDIKIDIKEKFNGKKDR